MLFEPDIVGQNTEWRRQFIYFELIVTEISIAAYVTNRMIFLYWHFLVYVGYNAVAL